MLPGCTETAGSSWRLRCIAAPRNHPNAPVLDNLFNVVYGYFDMLTRYIVESGDWDRAANIPLLVPSRDFVAAQLQLQTMAAVAHKEAAGVEATAEKLASLVQESGQDPFVQQIITIQAREAQALAAKASGNTDEAVAKMQEAIAIEDAIDTLSQPPYPIIPAHELFGTLLMGLNRPSDAKEQFLQTLRRTPGRPKAIYGIAKAAQAIGDNIVARQRYEEFMNLWKNADAERPELATAKLFLAKITAVKK